MKKVLLTAVLSLMMCMGVFAQDYMNPPKANETTLGEVKLKFNYEGLDYPSYESVYNRLLTKAVSDYPKYSDKALDIREMACSFYLYETSPYSYTSKYEISCSGKVVWVMTNEDILSQALNKAMRNVREGSRLAIDQVKVTSSMDRGEFKDQLIDVLLDKGYKVVAKEYLEKLYEEQRAQQSGIYNENTTVRENNFSAVGYYINVKVTETSLRVQVVNVSTGEYEGNATVNF